MSLTKKFLMDESLSFKKPDSLTTEQATTGGVGLLVRKAPHGFHNRELIDQKTSSLGLLSGLKLDVPSEPSRSLDEWLMVLGASGAVGQFAVQVSVRKQTLTVLREKGGKIMWT